MKALALLQHELRNARTSLLASACLTVALLAILHVFGCTPTETATGLPFIWSLCALQFAADSFATDLGSGRLATRAALPVSGRTLWSSKLLSFVASIALLASFGIAIELAWQGIFGRPNYCHEFIAALPAVGSALIVLALIGSAGMLCSLVVESALTAMVLTSMVLAGMWGLLLALEESVKLVGESFWGRNPEVDAVVFAIAFLAVGGIAFLRSQKKLGDSVVRVRAILIGALVMTVGLAGTVAAAGWHWSNHGLEDPRLQIYPPIASPDGRFIAFMAEPQHRGGSYRGPTERPVWSVWVLDLETGERRLIAAPGQIARTWYGGRWKGWTQDDGLEVFAESPWTWKGAHALRLRVAGGELVTEPIADPRDAIGERLPDWATVTERRDKKTRARSTIVQWKDTAFERTFEGEWIDTQIGRGIVLSPTPGRIFARHGKELVLLDLATQEERVVIEDCKSYMDLSPDGAALLQQTETQVHVLSTEDGSELHEPWPSKECRPAWIPGDDRSHELKLVRYGQVIKTSGHPRTGGVVRSKGSTQILDLEHGHQLDVEGELWHSCFARVGDRGYVDLDEQGDLVWIDREGKLVKVLIDRGAKRTE